MNNALYQQQREIDKLQCRINKDNKKLNIDIHYIYLEWIEEHLEVKSHELRMLANVFRYADEDHVMHAK